MLSYKHNPGPERLIYNMNASYLMNASLHVAAELIKYIKKKRYYTIQNWNKSV